MASLPLLFFLCSFSLSPSLHAFVFPVSRDLSTGQYLAQIRLGDSPAPVKLVVDLSGPILWFHCSSTSSSSRHLTSGSSSDCAKARSGGALQVFSSRGHDEVCQLLVRNSFAGLTTRGELAGDFLSVENQSATTPGDVDLLFVCAPQRLLSGLAGGAHGVLGLGRAQISLPSQLARHLTVYLSPANGVVSTASAEEVFGADVSRSLVYTPLFSDSSGNYVINLKSIRVNGVKLSFDAPLSAELSTLVPYTVVESSIYKRIAESLTNAVNGTAVLNAVAPFGLCFPHTTAFDAEPVVEFALQSEMVRWKISGRNLMVDIGRGIRCLGIVDGGSGRVNPIVMGGLQLEGFVLDFDLGKSVMGFGQRGARSGSLPLEVL